MSEPSQPKELCRYTYEDGVHTFLLLESSKVAIDEWLTQMTDVVMRLNAELNNDPALILVDFHLVRFGTSVIDVVNAVQQWTKATYRRQPAYVAVIVGNNTLMGLGNVMLRMARFTFSIRLFANTDHHNAIVWLKEVRK